MTFTSMAHVLDDEVIIVPDDEVGKDAIKGALAEAVDLLPHQAILENFVHHNPWEKLQWMEFAKANQHVRDIMAYPSPGERMMRLVNADPRSRAMAALVELSAVFLDRGVAKWEAPNRDQGFLFFFASLEHLGFAPWRFHARARAQEILEACGAHRSDKSTAALLKLASQEPLAHAILRENLKHFGARPEKWMETLRSMLWEMPGWAGMFHRMEVHTSEAPPDTRVRVADFCAVLSIFLRSSMDDMAAAAGLLDPSSETTLASLLSRPAALNKVHGDEAFQHPSGLAYLDQNMAQREKLEEEMESMLASAVLERGSTEECPRKRPHLQLITCIDDRECSLRRHAEEASSEVETFGVAGFFDFPMKFSPVDGRETMILAPEGNRPDVTLVEEWADEKKAVRFNSWRAMVARLGLVWEHLSFSPIGSLALGLLCPFWLLELVLTCFFPTAKRYLLRSLSIEATKRPETDFKIPFTAARAAAGLAKVFKNIGLSRQDREFARIVVVFGHGSRTVNNPFAACYNCGACGGREGGPNARLMARCANDPDVRSVLKKEYQICIPEDTWFVSGFHDTTAELLELADVDRVPASHTSHLQKAQDLLEVARGKTAVERCRMFMLAQHCTTPELALVHTHSRTSDLGQSRPELNHATNAAVIVGRRELSKGLFLARRAFLASYDPFNDDERGTNLELVITPALVVCSGISLEYLYSTTDGGAGTKVVMNMVGNFGVMQGATGGDLLVGLPTQMTEFHTPVRAMFLVDAPLGRLEAVLGRTEVLRDLVHNSWVRLCCRDPTTGQFYKHEGQGTFSLVSDASAYTARCCQHGQCCHQVHEDGRCCHQGHEGPDATSEGDPRIWPALGQSKPVLPPCHLVEHLRYGRWVASREAFATCLASLAMILSCIASTIVLLEEASAGDVVATSRIHSEQYLSRAPAIIAFTTLVALCGLGFSRRYLHGEFMFDRLVLLAAGMLVGLHLVVAAPSLGVKVGGWSLQGLCSTFLIGAYNDRPTARNNATYVFMVYQFSDTFLLIASVARHACAAHFSEDCAAARMVALSLIAAAVFKTSQFPVINVFIRSMEATTPSSAMNDGVLTSLAGIVLLLSTKALWFWSLEARATLAFVGALTALVSGVMSKIRADRKGSLAIAISGTLGTLYILVAAGFDETALVLALGHSAFRMVQLLRVHNLLLDHRNLRAALHNSSARQNIKWWMEPAVVPERLYRLGWALNRMLTEDFLQPHILHKLGRFGSFFKEEASVCPLDKYRQWMLTSLVVFLAGLPFTPATQIKEALLQGLYTFHPLGATFLMFVLGPLISTGLVWLVLAKVLDPQRFRHHEQDKHGSSKAKLVAEGRLDTPLLHA
eukprot:CAMPEP_0203860318 /NCGR_PEP_ID=MMETSP0359-20131031/12353_1 /ASSEMBLY_ACC=CAM_ASM_000338 /TAXON_ID=268821 /ORGANISM="Scrippsiella Hangoei, Strain SHTV-5" /LENGTH=1351 /DNA_ID=CAMNT_0050777367 /DNA_START=153 /DNA_END=4208 /DNA_ORIENTATION=-